MAPKKLNSITKKRLKERGWTDALIAEFMPVPDSTAVNMHYKSGPRVCFYLASRVERIEKQKRFLACKKHADVRSTAAKKAAQTKCRKTEAIAESINFKIQRLSKKKLLADACAAFNDWRSNDFNHMRATPDDPNKNFLHRICVNYLRHEISNYDEELEKLKGYVGAQAAREMIKEKVLEEIAKKYPFLEDECRNQRSRIGEWM